MFTIYLAVCVIIQATQKPRTDLDHVTVVCDVVCTVTDSLVCLDEALTGLGTRYLFIREPEPCDITG